MKCPICGNVKYFNLTYSYLRIFCKRNDDNQFVGTWDESEPASLYCSECNNEMSSEDRDNMSQDVDFSDV